MKKQNNGLTRDKFCKDAEGNVVGCPNCESTDLRKDGFQYWKNNRKRQRFYCNSCFKKTIAPEIIEENKFARMVEPDEDIDIKELIKYRNKRYNKKYSAYEQKKLIDIAININGPIGICHFGDPHVDDDGTNLAEIFDLCDLIESTDGMFAGNLGDVQNNWVGRLQALHGQQATTAKESWALTEYFLEKLTWLYLIAGNHDVWSGDGDPLDFIMRGKPTIYQQHGARMNLVFPNGRTVRINARHQFKGHSMWNTAHAISRAVQTGWRDHILTAGHIHVSGYQVLKDPASGLISHAIQVASFKNMDSYADKLGLDDRNIFNAPVTIIDPAYEDNDNRLITTFFNPYEGAEYLKYKRKKYKKLL